jgi:hypothetical protein
MSASDINTLPSRERMRQNEQYGNTEIGRIDELRKQHCRRISAQSQPQGKRALTIQTGNNPTTHSIKKNMVIQTLQEHHCEGICGGSATQIRDNTVNLTLSKPRRVIYGGQAYFSNNGSQNNSSFNVRGKNALGSFNVGPTTTNQYID